MRIEAAKTSGAHGSTKAMSPVNQNGSFEFDRVLKAGTVVKRTRKTKQWKLVYLVLRPNLLSIYRDKDESKLRHRITLSEITAIARQKDSKKKMDHVFAIFSPERNYHFGASTDTELHEWVQLIRAEARIDKEEAEMILMSPPGKKAPTSFVRPGKDKVASSSSEAEPWPSSSMAPYMYSARQPSYALQYSGNERASSDFSDTTGPVPSTVYLLRTPHQLPNASQQSAIGVTPDEERVVFHGCLYVLKSKGGVRQWKKVWVVLRPKTLGLYKNDQEYRAHLIIPFDTIIDAVDIDPVSKSKQYCMQVISEEKNFRFCAPNENSLAKWLGAFKSLLVKRREGEHQRVRQAAADAGGAPPAQSVANVPAQPSSL